MEGEQLNVGQVIGGRTADSNTPRPTAFTRGYTPTKYITTDNGTSRRSNAKTETDGAASSSASLDGIDKPIRELQSTTRGNIIPVGVDTSTDTIDVGRSEQSQDGSTRPSGSIDTPQRRRGNPGGPRGSYNKSNVSGESVDNRDIHKNEDSVTGVSITVESSAIDDEPVTDIVPEKKARVKKPKEPPRGKVDEVSASLQDVYQIIDMVTESFVKFLGKGDMYPKDLMCLEPDVAQRLSRNLVQLNDSMPKLAAKFNSVSVPAMLVSTLATDLFGKGVMLYAIVKSPNPS